MTSKQAPDQFHYVVVSIFHYSTTLFLLWLPPAKQFSNSQAKSSLYVYPKSHNQTKPKSPHGHNDVVSSVNERVLRKRKIQTNKGNSMFPDAMSLQMSRNPVPLIYLYLVKSMSH